MTISASPSISVIMAVKNSARYLRTAIDSVLAQTRPPDEIILVDGKSTDQTEQMARGYPQVTFIQESGTGYAGAWNDGIHASRGELIAILDSDDRWSRDKLERQAGALAANPDAQCALGHVRFFVEPGEELPRSFKPQLLERDHVGYFPGTLLARRALFDEIGPFTTRLQIANDVDWFARLKDRRVPVTIVPDVILFKRVHGRNLSYTAARTTIINDELLRVLRSSIHRQRAATTDGGAE